MEKFKLMLVDDEPWALIGMEEIIDWNEAGYEIVARCSSGTEALEAAKRLYPDAVVTDVRMPDMTGLELIGRLREKLPQMQCMVVSAYSDFEVAREAIRLAAVYYALKPLSAEEIREAAGIMREKLDQLRAAQGDAVPVLQIDPESPAFPFPEENERRHYLLLADSSLDLPERPAEAGVWQPLQIGLRSGVLTDWLPTELPETVGVSVGFSDNREAKKMLRMARASLRGGFRYPEQSDKKRSQMNAAEVQFYLYEHKDEDISLEQLSQCFYITQTYLCDTFKKQTGETVVGFLRRVRINYARRLLADSALPLAEVALRCGYKDYSYFGRTFKADVGCPPDLYRKRLRQ